ncbi:hypothetical protein [Pseudodesulfovibrio sp.]|jgi:hypothetical protein|uniref:hypothetical protein n=1 Tax=Pseudodesulfovibrio sp. TaxID=2035812 RepID=UPI002620292A|nr:hypothetical protein [Pseudodesulfovibrio sp.]MDD3311207.1 hypothetical protein [Pseudodesulfovibrio sp.]
MKYQDLSRRDVLAKEKKYNISYRCTSPRKGGPVYRKVFFSDDYIAECGWNKGDRIRVVYSPEQNALGFKMVTFREEDGFVRALTKAKNSRDHYIKLVGDFEVLPFIDDRIELKELDVRQDGFSFASLPATEEDSTSESADSGMENIYDRLHAVEPVDGDDDEYDLDDELDALDALGR